MLGFWGFMGSGYSSFRGLRGLGVEVFRVLGFRGSGLEVSDLGF